MKLQSRLAEAEGCVSNLNGKAMALEREKAKLQSEIEEAIVAVEDAEARCMAMEKKANHSTRMWPHIGMIRFWSRRLSASEVKRMRLGPLTLSHVESS